MAEQADLSAAYAISDWNERGQYVVDTLKATAERSQKDAIGQLNRQGARFTSYFVSNVIVVRGGNQHALDAVQNLPGVARVRAPVVVRLEPVEELLRRAVEIKLPQAILAGTPTWGLTDTKAPAFWSTYGRQGEGIIVANIDSGVQYDHPALAGAYRCGGGVAIPYTACWKDATTTPSSTAPYDDNGHGTHTMGTMVGTNLLYNSAPYTIGMAPAADWIACKAFDQYGNAYDADIIECAQWLLAPGGSAANRPHVINNSWGGETTASDSWFRSYVQAWRAAGMFPVFSAGNKGSGCTTLGSPADYPEGFAVAAHDSSRNIASFSSRGPITLGVMPYTKPNLSAPGKGIISAYLNGGSASLQGTSMAAPHVSGAAALLWSCNPALIGQIDQTFQLLQNSAGIPPAGSCGAPATGGNYTYGYGYLNVFQAGQGACGDWFNVYLPIVLNNYYISPTPTPTPTLMPTITPTPTPTSIPTVTPTPMPTSIPTVTPAIPLDPIQNGGFESGDVTWLEYSLLGYDLILNASEGLPVTPHTGSWASWLGGDNDEFASISQSVTIPVGRSILHYWFASGSTDICDYDYFKIFVGGTPSFSETLCDTTETNAWVHRTLDLTAYAGTAQTIEFYIETDFSDFSNVFLDDISFETSTALSGSAVNGSPVPLPVDGSASERLKTSKQD
ncbi:MAG: S8 family serine peptidase [Bellilinea sp.]